MSRSLPCSGSLFGKAEGAELAVLQGLLRDCSVTAAESGLAQHRMGCGLRRAEQDTHPGAAWAWGERKRPQPAPEQVWRHSPDTLYPKERQNRPKMYPAWGENAYPGNSPVQGSASPGSRNKNASDPAQPQETPATPSSPWGWRSPLQTTNNTPSAAAPSSHPSYHQLLFSKI